MTEAFWDNVLLFKGAYDQALDPVAQRWGLTRMELDLLLFLANNPAHDTAAEAVRLRRWTKSHVSAAVHSLQDKGLLSAEHPEGNRKALRLTPLPAAGEMVRAGQDAQRSFYQAMYRGFTPEEERVLEAVSEKIARNIRNAMKK
ncbi:MAG: MarR family transcriptional regulator [Clostridiales bacterium]|nr:MarR family transcriptional regulator [Clostridiales bacterium]